MPLQFCSTSTSYHNLFIKEHLGRNSDDNKPLGQTLFVLNIPPYVTNESLKLLFASAGTINQITIEDVEDNYTKNDGFKRGYIVFKSREGLLKALNLKKWSVLSTKQNCLNTGIEKWVKEYNESTNTPEQLQNKIDDYMKNYDENEKNNKTEITDSDGWIVVTKGGRKSGLSRKESVVNNINLKNVKKKMKKELKNFYTFQIRETQMKNIAELRNNYEEAKHKVKLMKAARKFKPY